MGGKKSEAKKRKKEKSRTKLRKILSAYGNPIGFTHTIKKAKK